MTIVSYDYEIRCSKCGMTIKSQTTDREFDVSKREYILVIKTFPCETCFKNDKERIKQLEDAINNGIDYANNRA